MRAEQWGELIGASLGAGVKERAVLEIASSRERMAMMAPVEVSFPDGWDTDEGERKHRFIDDLRKAGREIADLREAAQAMPLAFGEWRRYVCDIEAANAAKLQVLMWIVQTLHVLEQDDSDYERLKYDVMKFIDRVWGINELPVSGSYRDWCVRMTRKPNLLPNAWRYV